MNRYKAAVSAFLALASLAPILASAEKPARRAPAVQVEEAIHLTRKHFKAHKIDASNHYLDSIKLQLNPGSERGAYWHMTWELSEYAKGGQIITRVYMNKSVEVGYGE